MDFLKANEARAIAEKNNPEFIVKNIIERITKKAEDGEFELKVRDFGFGDSVLYNEDLNKLQQKAVDELEKLGYKVRLRVVTNQFVDIYLEIKW